MITGHVWRPLLPTAYVDGTPAFRLPVLDRPCEFMNCRRPRAEHERAVKRVTE